MKAYLLVICITIFGMCLAQTENLTDTISSSEKAIPLLHTIIKKFPNDPLAYCQMAQRKLDMAQYDSSIYFSNRCMELLLSNKDELLHARALHIKGNAQYYLDDKIKSEKNWRESLQISLDLNDSSRVMKLASNLGAIYVDRAYQSKRNDYFKTADSFFSIAYNEIKRTRSEETIQGLLTLRLMATSFHFQKKYDSADIYYNKVIQGSKGNAAVYTGALSFYAEALSETGRHSEAVKLMQEVMEIIKDSSFRTKDLTHHMHMYGTVLFNSGDFKEAYRFMDSSYNLLAADYQKVNNEAYAESESRFRNQLLQYEVQLEKQRKNRLYFIIGGLLLMAAFLFLFINNRNNKRITKEKARQKQISIDAFIEGEEKEKARIGRELHDGIAQEIVAVKLAMQEKQVDIKMIDELSRITSDIRNISHELMPQTLKEYGLQLAIEDTCQKLLIPSGIHYEVHASLPAERMENKIEITLYRIFQELIHNIIKHSHATEVLVQLRKMNNHIMMIVEDNGKGITSKKTDGIGISNVKSRVQLVDGNIQYETSESEGTTAIVRIPYN